MKFWISNMILVIDAWVISYEIGLKWITLLVISQQWFKKWLGAVRQQHITWAIVDPDLYRHMASVGHNVLNSLPYWIKFTTTIKNLNIDSWYCCYYQINGCMAQFNYFLNCQCFSLSFSFSLSISLYIYIYIMFDTNVNNILINQAMLLGTYCLDNISPWSPWRLCCKLVTD